MPSRKEIRDITQVMRVQDMESSEKSARQTNVLKRQRLSKLEAEHETQDSVFPSGKWAKGTMGSLCLKTMTTMATASVDKANSSLAPQCAGV